jgi:putative protease
MVHKTQSRKDLSIPELLAPAGSPESFHAAIAAGADAVYLSGKRFGARKFAQNFTEPEIKEAVEFAQARDIRVYVTINTLIHDRELAEAGEYLIRLYSMGVDAVLVQDIGVAALARDLVPDLLLHASTQMTIDTAEGVQWAAGEGFSRVVLARELSLEEVEVIARKTENTGVGLEVFAHGALCYSYSGQCLLSSVIGGRSGNRGMCAQPCLKPYTLVTGRTDTFGRPRNLRDVDLPERYLLSPKDLCTYKNLERLVHSPIVSLKIEGRMKSPEYVATVVSIYRRALDAIAMGDWTPDDADMRDLALAFNRGFTKGYLFGDRLAALMGRDQPDNRGLLIGRVKGFNRQNGEVIISTTTPFELSAGDGLLFLDAGEEFGFYLNTSPQKDNGMIMIPVPRPVRTGTLVFLTSGITLAAQAHRVISGSSPQLRHLVPVDLSVLVDDEGAVLLEGTIETREGRHINVSCTSGTRLPEARAHPLTPQQIEAQLKKTGGTPFTIRKFTLQYGGGRFAPVAELNRIRRNFLSLTKKALIDTSQPSETEIAQAQARWVKIAHRFDKPILPCTNQSTESPGISVYAGSIDVVRAAAAAGCDRICFEPDISDVLSSNSTSASRELFEKQLFPALLICRDAGIPLVWKLPRITRTRDLEIIYELLPGLHRKGLVECMVESTGAAQAVRNAVPEMRIAGSMGLNVFNHMAVCRLATNFSRLTLSPELSGKEIEDLVLRSKADGCDTIPEMIVQGSAEAMVSEDNILEPLVNVNVAKQMDHKTGRFFGIRDSRGQIFPVHTDGAGRTHIFNAVETCLIDYLPSLVQWGVRSVAIDARGRTPAYAADMVRLYRDAIRTGNKKGSIGRSRFTQYKEQIKGMALGGITTVHFIRGLKEA